MRQSTIVAAIRASVGLLQVRRKLFVHRNNQVYR